LRLVEGALDLVAADAVVDQGRRAQELEVHGVAVHARHDAAAGLERLLELALAPERPVTEGIGKVLDLDGWVERAQIPAISGNLRGQRFCIEVAGARVGKGVAADLVAIAMQIDDVLAIDGGPVGRCRADQAARNIEDASPAGG
jgi:hypothetical protein